ncbi:MAG: lipopolysaccharide kinase InaA family protein [Dialister sp.]|nr:lipopolysaccharide kinase InaA family protein [Dialister sp.]
MNDSVLQEAAEREIALHRSEKIIRFAADGAIYWIKRRRSNGRNRLVKYSPAIEFQSEVARITIAAAVLPELVPQIVVLTPSYMVTKDTGESIEDWLDEEDVSGEDKEHMLYEVGRGLARLHNAGIAHGRPAPRDITWQDGRVTFLDWENRLYFKRIERQRVQDFLLLFQGIYRRYFPEEQRWAAALERGYASEDKSGTRERAVAFLRKRGYLRAIMDKLTRFHMHDVEAVAKVYAHFLHNR